MRSIKIFGILFVLMLAVAGCSSQNETKENSATIKEDPAVTVDENNPTTENPAVAADETNPMTENPAVAADEGEKDSDITAENDAESGIITDEIALDAIKNYCLQHNPDLKDIIDEGNVETYWTVESGDDNRVVILYRSYTAALVRYYIDRASGETYVTEYVDGITPDEMKTDEAFNIKDYVTTAGSQP